MSFLTKRGTIPINEEYLKSLGYVNVESCNPSVSVWRNTDYFNTPIYEIVVIPGERVSDFESLVTKLVRAAKHEGKKEKEEEILVRLQQKAKEFIKGLI